MRVLVTRDSTGIDLKGSSAGCKEEELLSGVTAWTVMPIIDLKGFSAGCAQGTWLCPRLNNTSYSMGSYKPVTGT